MSLKPFIVVHTALDEEFPDIDDHETFMCYAENEAHAFEQCADANPVSDNITAIDLTAIPANYLRDALKSAKP